jgi:hypothetical protein
MIGQGLRGVLLVAKLFPEGKDLGMGYPVEYPPTSLTTSKDQIGRLILFLIKN